MEKIPGPFHPAMEDEAGLCSLVLVRSMRVMKGKRQAISKRA